MWIFLGIFESCLRVSLDSLLAIFLACLWVFSSLFVASFMACLRDSSRLI